MGKALDYIKKEKDYYGNMLYKINSAINELSPYVDDKELANRKYVTRVTVLQRYIELLNEIETEEKKESLLGFLNDKSRIDKLEEFKMSNREEIVQLEKCSKCKRLNCPPTCKFTNCIDCRRGSWVVYCDHKRVFVRFHDDFMLDLTNDRTAERERYKVLATMYDGQRDRQYIIIEGIKSQDKYVLYYYPGIIEDTYGEIHDEDEFNFVVSTFESIER